MRGWSCVGGDTSGNGVVAVGSGWRGVDVGVEVGIVVEASVRRASLTQ